MINTKLINEALTEYNYQRINNLNAIMSKMDKPTKTQYKLIQKTLSICENNYAKIELNKYLRLTNRKEV